MRGVVEVASLAVLLQDSCWGRVTAGEEDLRKYMFPEPVRSLSEDVDTMERESDVDLESR